MDEKKKETKHRVGIFGGSFNPIHKAHVSLADAICKEAGLDEVWFMVSPQNPLKRASSLMDDDLRYRMVQAALEDYPHLSASDFEFHLERPSYTWNTLHHLEETYPDCEFSLIIGGDNWVLFPRWARHEEILATHSIYVYPRSEYEFEESQLPANVHLMHTPNIDISSTQIRQWISEGRDISEWVDRKVIEILKEHSKK